MSIQKTAAMPALFVGHGNPMLSITDNHYARAWTTLGQQLPKPKAILMISAHWYIPETRVTAMLLPQTMHDFYGFPEELFQVEYPAAGDEKLAETVADLMLPDKVTDDFQWGLDHGAWSVLRHIYPRADVPVVQLSLDQRKSAEEHYRQATRLAVLRDEGILLIGSGNIVHNLAGFNWERPQAEPPPWAIDFEAWNRHKLLKGEPEGLIDYLNCGEQAHRSAPTPDHYLPLLYLAAAQSKQDDVSFPVEGFDGGTMSMLTVLLSACKIGYALTASEQTTRQKQRYRCDVL